MLRKGSTWGSGGDNEGVLDTKHGALSIDSFWLISINILMSPIWFTLSLKRTTLASDEGMPDLLMTWVLGLCHATSLQSHMDVSVRPPTMLNCVYIHLLHYESLEGRSCNFFSFFQPPSQCQAHGSSRLLFPCLFYQTTGTLCFVGREERESLQGRKKAWKTSVYVCVCVRAQLLSHVRLFGTPWTAACQAFHWRREWQTTPVYLPLEPHELYKKAKR